jgi:hypothetical protein
MSNLLPKTLILEARKTMQSALANTHKMHSTRAMAFTIKGIYYANKKKNFENVLIKLLANRLVQMYNKIKTSTGIFESYMTYGNSILRHTLCLSG